MKRVMSWTLMTCHLMTWQRAKAFTSTMVSGITGSLVSLKKLPLEDSDIHDLLSEQQIVNVRMAFDNLEPDDRLGAAERFAMGDYTGWQAQEVCKAYREHLPKSVIDTIADSKLTPGEMRALINIAALTEPSSDGVGVPQRPAFSCRHRPAWRSFP